jgi:hypothetical protein
VVRSQWCRTEIDGQPLAPDRNGLVLRQVQTSAQRVVLVTDGSLDRSQIDEVDTLHCRAVLCIVSGDQVHVDTWAVRGTEVREAENAISVPKAVDGCCTCGGVHNRMKCSGRKGMFERSALRGRQFFVDTFIDDKTLRPESVPGDEQCDDERGNSNVPFTVVQFRISSD